MIESETGSVPPGSADPARAGSGSTLSAADSARPAGGAAEAERRRARQRHLVVGAVRMALYLAAAAGALNWVASGGEDMLSVILGGGLFGFGLGIVVATATLRSGGGELGALLGALAGLFIVGPLIVVLAALGSGQGLLLFSHLAGTTLVVLFLLAVMVGGARVGAALQRHRRYGAALLVGAAVLGTAAAYHRWANQELSLAAGTYQKPPSPNGYYALLAATGGPKRDADQPPVFQRGEAVNDPDSASVEALRRELAQDRPARERARRAVRMEFLVPTSEDFSDPVPNFLEIRQAARQFAAEARVLRAEGKAAAALESSLDAVDLMKLSRGGGTLMQFMIGVHCAGIGVAAAEQCIPDLTADEAAAAGRRLDALLAHLPSLPESLRAEERASLRSFQAARQTDAKALGLSAWLLSWYPWPWSFAAYSAAMDQIQEDIGKPFPEQTHSEPKVAHDLIASLSVPNHVKANLAAIRNVARLRLLRIMLALQEHHAREGRYPASLDAIAGMTAARTGLDPYTEKPFLYSVQGDSYRLYSAGPNLADDGGTTPSEALERNAPGDIIAGRLREPVPPKR